MLFSEIIAKFAIEQECIYMNNSDIQRIKQRYDIIGNSPGLERAIDTALQVAPTDMTVLITGESGVGKENFPQIIHQNSRRKHGQYIAVNCGAIPEGTIDSELFGHEKGSFTGALGDRKGYFEVVDKGTIFLDEVGELPIATQARLLRILESGEFIKVGSSKVQKTDVRVIAATNVNLVEAVRNGKFREDLYYRLNTVPIYIPPLRERGDDILMLFKKFALDCSDKYMMPVIVLTEDAQKALKSYHWPGNVRELKNLAERISVIEQEREITVDILESYLPSKQQRLPVLLKKQEEEKMFNSEREILYQVLFDMKRDVNDLKALVHDIMGGTIKIHPYDEVSALKKTTSTTPSSFTPVDESFSSEVEEVKSLDEVERDAIIVALERNEGSRKLAAKDLKISERTLYRKIKEHGIA